MYAGIAAKLMVGDATIGYISNWSVEETRDIIEITSLGSSLKEKKPTMYSWSASADGTADFSTDEGQDTLRNAMLNGTEITAKFYLDATTFLTGTALVESMSLDISAEDKGNISISLSGIGNLTFTNSATV